MPNITWSYSSLSLFQQCPKKYYHLRVVKDVVEPPTEALSYGTKVHEAAENFIKLGTPLPPEYSFMQPSLDSLNKLPGEKLCEYRMGLTRNLEPCDFFGLVDRQTEEPTSSKAHQCKSRRVNQVIVLA